MNCLMHAYKHFKSTLSPYFKVCARWSALRFTRIFISLFIQHFLARGELNGSGHVGFKSRLGEFKNEMKPTVRELKFVIYRVRRNPLSLVGVIIFLFFIVVALLAPLLAPPMPGEDPYICPYDGGTWGWYITPLPSPPSAKHPFGTLEGYDIYYGCIWGTRTAFRISSLVIFGVLVIGLFMGCVAGYCGGLIDELMMRFADIFFAFPGLLLAIVLFVALPSVWSVNLGPIRFAVAFSHLDKLIVALVLVGWPSYARLIRGEIMKVKNEDYVEAAKAIGCSGPRVMVRHILPNSIYPVLIMAFLDIGGIVLSAATLSFLGFGPETGYADWATIISASRRFILGAPQEPFKYAYTFIMPSMFISGFILAWSLLGDALRDILDPTLRRR